jgi:hypothetical protein
MAVGIAGHCYYWPRGWRPFHQTILKLPTRLNRSPDRDTHTSEIGRLDGQSRESSNRRPFAHTAACIANSALTASTADLRARGSGRGARVDRSLRISMAVPRLAPLLFEGGRGRLVHRAGTGRGLPAPAQAPWTDTFGGIQERAFI